MVVDDGSRDSKALQQCVVDLQDNRFSIIRRENAGGGAARNTGIQHARGQYVAFLDSDDLFLPQKLETCAHFLKHQKSALNIALYSYMYVDRGVAKKWIRPNRPIGRHEDMGAYLFIANEFIQTSTLVMPRTIALETLFDPTLRKGQDLDFCLRLYKNGVRFQMIEEPLTVWVDQTEAGRTSRVRGYDAPLTWLEKARPLLTRKAELGYRATVLAYYMAKAKPLTVLLDLIKGWWIAGVPARVIARQFLRGFLPRGFYRSLVNGFVHRFGKSAMH